MNMGRWRRRRSARSTAPLPRMGSGLAVEEITMSASASRSGISGRPMPSPP